MLDDLWGTRVFVGIFGVCGKMRWVVGVGDGFWMINVSVSGYPRACGIVLMGYLFGAGLMT